MARTVETRDAIVEGGPADGLRMRVKLKDDGTAEVIEGEVFLGGVPPYFYDRERDRIVFHERLSERE
jgi:hypothetical protein